MGDLRVVSARGKEIECFFFIDSKKEKYILQRHCVFSGAKNLKHKI